MGIDDSHGTIAADIISRKEKVTQAERDLAHGMTRSMPNVELQIADRDLVTLFEFLIDFASRHRDFNILGLDECVSYYLIARLERFDGHGMGGDFRAEQFLGACESLCVIGVRVRCD